MQTQTIVAQSFPKVEVAKSTRHLEIKRHFTKPDQDVFETVEWERRDAVIKGKDGQIVFEQKGVEFPKSWSQLATNVTTEKYFRGKLGSDERETSLRQVIHRVADTVARWGIDQGYFDVTKPDVSVFYDELVYILLHQKAAFNSPVWFNLGVEGAPQQVSACFIQSVTDDMGSIMDLAKSEVMLFKGGSGTGSNLSALRSSKEHLRGGGLASGPVSFMRGFDAFAGVTKSGGRTRRAAKMVILNVDHPDIVPFIKCKGEEERKARALIDAGWDSDWNASGGAYDSVQYQNANNSVRVNDEFMHAVMNDSQWRTKLVTTGEPAESYRAKAIMKLIAEQTHACGDPGMQFDTTINTWNTCANSGRINASNPCSEYMHLDDSACNLASLNLRAFERSPNGMGWFDVEAFAHTVRTMIIAQDILVDPAAYPTEPIGRNARVFRQLGLGYSNLGGLLMARGIPYDSDEGRNIAALITDTMQAAAYGTSAEIGSKMGTFSGYEKNHESMVGVVERHVKAHNDLVQQVGSYGNSMNAQTIKDLTKKSGKLWESSKKNQAYRNAQVTVLAPAGTISFMMDCDTTGIEPELGLSKVKSLAGGGSLTLINKTVDSALIHLGYGDTEIEKVKECIKKNKSIEGCVRPEHVAVFDCAFRAPGGKRVISPMGHLRMMAAVQPFISGAISKTINVGHDTSVEEIENLYLESWKLGLKAVAIYRDGCKKTQPLSTGVEKKIVPARRRLNDERSAICHKFTVAGHEGYFHVGLYEDGSMGEIFIRMAKEGSTISGMMDAFATSISIGLQYGVPLYTFIEKFKHSRFEPSGVTNNNDIRIAQSIIDYIFRWLEIKFMTPQVQAPEEDPKGNDLGFVNQTDAPMCHTCGNITVRSGTCFKCLTCGASNGCS